MGASFRDTQRTRYMMRRYHYVREGVESNQHALIWINNSAQVADMGTKILGRILLMHSDSIAGQQPGDGTHGNIRIVLQSQIHVVSQVSE